MREIGSQEREHHKRKKYAQIFSILLLIIMVFSTLGYAFFSNPDSGQQNTIDNSQIQQIADGQWGFIFGERQIVLTTSPDEARNITFVYKPTLSDFSQQVVYIDASDTIANEIASAIAPYASRVQQACYGNCTKDLPEQDCNQTMIVWKNTNNQMIYNQDKCIFIDGDKRAIDAFIYQTFSMLNG